MVVCGRQALQPTDGFVSVPGGRVWYRVVGSGSRTPLLLVQKGGENSTDARRCTARSSQTGKRCKNASILGGRVCRFHGGAAPQTIAKAAERLLALEHPAIDVFKRVLEADEAHPEHRALAVRVAATVLDRTGHKHPEKLELESRQTLDASILSTSTLRQIAAELRQHEARNRSPLTPGSAPHERPED
jgi:hypothetical protein